MKTFLFILALFPTIIYGQSVLPLRADTVRIEKVGGSGELQVRNASRGVLGILTNVGGGATRFIKTNRVQDTLFIGRDTIIGARKVDTLYRDGDSIRFTIAGSPYAIEGGKTYTNGFGAGDGLVSGTTIKRLEAGYGIDHFVSSGNIKVSVDTNEVATPYDLTQLSIIHEPITGVLFMKDSNNNVGSDTAHFNYNAGNLNISRVLADEIRAVRSDTIKTAAFVGKNLYICGNSLVVGLGATSGPLKWSNIASLMLGATEVNHGISSSTMEKRSPVDPIVGGVNALDRLSDIPTYNASTDSWLISAYGMNDWGYTGANYNPANFQTDYATWIANAVSKGWPLNRILIISPSYVTDAAFTFYSSITGLTAPTRQRMLDFVAASKNVARAGGVQWFDMYNYMRLNGGNTLLTTDGVHPNDKGYRVYANAIVNKLGGHVVDTGRVITDVANINYRMDIGSAISGSTSAPADINMNTSFQPTPDPGGSKIKLYYDGVTNNTFGVSVISGAQIYHAGGATSTHTFYINGAGPYMRVTETGVRINTFNKLWIGNVTTLNSTATPSSINLGSDIADVPGNPNKLKITLYDNGTSQLGFGASTLGMEYHTQDNLAHNFYTDSTIAAVIKPGGRLIVNNTNDTTLRRLYVDGSVGMHKDSANTVTSVTSQFVLLIDTASGVNKGKFKKIALTDLTGGGEFTLNTTTTDATPVGGTFTALSTSGQTTYLNVVFTAVLNDGDGAYGSNKARLFLKNSGGTVTSGSLVTIAADGYLGTGLSTATATVTTASGNPGFTITGETGKTIYWTVKVKATPANAPL